LAETNGLKASSATNLKGQNKMKLEAAAIQLRQDNSTTTTTTTVTPTATAASPAPQSTAAAQPAASANVTNADNNAKYQHFGLVSVLISLALFLF